MAKHMKRTLTDAERARIKRDRAGVEKDKTALIAQGQAVFERHERLRDAVRALKDERDAQGVSLAELARRTGISKTSLSRLENDPAPNPTVATLSRIAEALGRQITIRLEPAA